MSDTSGLMESHHRLGRALRRRGLTVMELTHAFSAEYAGIARFSLSFMPGNRRVLISHGVEVVPEKRGMGTGRKLLKMREEIAREAGANLILATVRNDNAAESHLLETSGWVRFTNRAESGVSLWGKLLT